MHNEDTLSGSKKEGRQGCALYKQRDALDCLCKFASIAATGIIMKNIKNIIYKSAIATQTRSRDQGFVMPIVIGLGIAMVLVAATIMMRSQIDRQNNEAQQTKAQDRSETEVAANRVLDLLNNNRNLATSSSHCGTSDPNKNFTNTTSTVCWKFIQNANTNPIQKYTRVCQDNAWSDQRTKVVNLFSNQAIDPGNSARGQYRLNSYTYTVEWKDDPDVSGNGIPSPNPKLGTNAGQRIPGALIKTIYGTLDLSTIANNNGAENRIQLDIPITPASRSDPIPGLWITTGDMTVSTSTTTTGNNRNRVAAQVWLSDCRGGDRALSQITTKVIEAKQVEQLPTDEPTVPVVRPYVKFIPLAISSAANALTSLTTTATFRTVSAINSWFTNSARGGNSTNFAFVAVTNRDFSRSNSGQAFNINVDPVPGPAPAPPSSPPQNPTCQLGTDPGILPSEGTAAASLPTDFDGDGNNEIAYYDYVVFALTNQTVTNANKTLTINPGCRVRLYILGNIDGTIKIIHNCPNNSTTCKPSNLQIYGLGQNSSRNFCFNDPNGANNILDAFVFAPSNPVGITNSVVRGAVWASTWGKISACSSATATRTLLIQKPITWSEIPYSLRTDSNYSIENVLPPKIGGDNGKPSNWKVCQPDTTKRCDGSNYN